jgi:hypothetical protein
MPPWPVVPAWCSSVARLRLAGVNLKQEVAYSFILYTSISQALGDATNAW